MPLKDSLNRIMELQELNRSIERHKGDKQALYVDVEDQRALLDRLERQREGLAHDKLEAQKAADALELKTMEAEETCAKLQVQLNVTKRQDDYDAIRQSILSHKADIAKAEDEELDLLQRIDQLDQQRAELEGSVDAERRKLKQLEGEVARQAAEYDSQVAQLEQERQALTGEIDQELLAAYQRVARKRGGSALVEVKGRVCQGCFTTVTKQTENQLLRDAEIVHCHSCGRILVLTDEHALLPTDEQP